MLDKEKLIEFIDTKIIHFTKLKNGHFVSFLLDLRSLIKSSKFDIEEPKSEGNCEVGGFVKREIKFRAWDDVDFKMTYGKLEEFDDMLGFRFHHFETDEPIYMQYTGIKDKKGKYIYERDIVGIKSSYHEPVLDDGSGPDYEYTILAEVIFQDGCFGCVFSESDDYFEKRYRHLLRRAGDDRHIRR